MAVRPGELYGPLFEDMKALDSQLQSDALSSEFAAQFKAELINDFRERTASADPQGKVVGAFRQMIADGKIAEAATVYRYVRGEKN